MNYTAIIGIYEGVANIDDIISSLKNQTIPPKEIVLWVNKHLRIGFNKNKYISDVDNIIMSEENGGCYSRYAACYLAKTDYIMMLDDDTIPGKKWAEKCINHINKYPNDIIGSRGIIIQGPSYRPNITIDPIFNNSKQTTVVDIVGHCTFFKRTHVKYMFEYLPTEWMNGEDIQFCAEAMRNDIRIVVLPQNNNDVDGLGSVNRELGSIAGRISTSNDKWHYSVRDELCSREVNERGWKPTYLKIGKGKINVVI